jgi:mono/diheme cytochrome c family protein
MTSRHRLRRRLINTLGVSSLLLTAGGSAPSWSQSAGPGMLGASKVTIASGAEIFHDICQGCHMPDAKGATGAGKYPALAGDPALASKEFMVITLLQGRRNMPAFGGDGDVGLFFKLPTLNDEQIAAVINYVRTNFGNQFPGAVTAAEVKAERLHQNPKDTP